MGKPIGETSTMDAALRGTGRRPRKGLLWAGLGVLVVVVVTVAFIGGRLLAQQRLVEPVDSNIMMRTIPAMPEGVPQEKRPAATGSVGKIEGKVVVVEEKNGQVYVGNGVWLGEPAVGGSEEETKQTEVVVTNDTVFYKMTPPSEDAQFEDLQNGQMILVWGEKSGGRVTAEIIVIDDAIEP